MIKERLYSSKIQLGVVEENLEINFWELEIGKWVLCFDFAKNITTGEGGMIFFKNKKDYEKAAAWHDLNMKIIQKTKMEDTRKSSGFNY